jgi:FMN reductase
MSIVVLGLSGSPKPNSSTSFVIQLALKAASERGAETDFCEVSSLGLPLCDGRDGSYGTAADAFLKRIQRAHGVIIGSPEYHGSITGVLKNALDLCSAKEFEHKMAGLIGVAGGALGANNALDHLRTIMRWLGAWSVPHQVSVARSSTLFSAPNTLSDPQLEARIQKLGYDVVKFASMLTQGILTAEDLD